MFLRRSREARRRRQREICVACAASSYHARTHLFPAVARAARNCASFSRPFRARDFERSAAIEEGPPRYCRRATKVELGSEREADGLHARWFQALAVIARIVFSQFSPEFYFARCRAGTNCAASGEPPAGRGCTAMMASLAMPDRASAHEYRRQGLSWPHADISQQERVAYAMLLAEGRPRHRECRHVVPPY